MTESSTNGASPIPEGYHTVTPWMISRNAAQLLEFVKAAFDAVEIARVVGEDGTIGHAEVRIGDSVVMMFDARPDWPDTPAFLRLYVEDGDATFQQALEAEATPVTEMTHLFWGTASGGCETRWATSGGSRSASKRSAPMSWRGGLGSNVGSTPWRMFKAPNSSQRTTRSDHR